MSRKQSLVIRAVMVVVILGNLSLLNAFWLNPDQAIVMYGVGQGELDKLHLTVGMLLGAAVAGYTFSAIAALVNPERGRTHILVLAVFHLVITATDLVIYTQGLANLQTLLVQTVYDTAITIVLLGLYLSTGRLARSQ